MAGARQQRKWPAQLHRFLFIHQKFGPLHLCFAMPLMHVLKQFSNLLQPFEPKIHMTESDFLSITCSGGTVTLLKCQTSCIQKSQTSSNRSIWCLHHHILLIWIPPDHTVCRTSHNYFMPFVFPLHSTVLAALCDADGCLGLAGFVQVMHDQIRTFTKSSLADTSRSRKLKWHAASFQLSRTYWFYCAWFACLNISLQLSLSRRNFLFAQWDNEIVDHGSTGQ